MTSLSKSKGTQAYKIVLQASNDLFRTEDSPLINKSPEGLVKMLSSVGLINNKSVEYK